ncbi:MAG: thioredoxin family protein [archaeon]
MPKLELKLFVQTNCPKCPAAKAIAKELTEKRSDVDLQILSIDEEGNKLSALMLQICSTPAFAVGEEVLFAGKVPTVESLSSKIDEAAKHF